LGGPVVWPGGYEIAGHSTERITIRGRHADCAFVALAVADHISAFSSLIQLMP
jgi:hypothetical protein